MAEETRRGGLTPISAGHLAELVQAGPRGASDALDNAPPATSTLPSQTELDLLTRVRDIAGAIRQEACQALAGLSAEIAARRQAFTQERYEARIGSVEATMRAMLVKHGGELEQKVYDALKAKREYAFFNYINQRTADPKLEKWQFVLAFLVVPLALESLLNGNFFADASDFGLIGGAATAVIISALNVSLGFVTGLGPARYCQHAKASHLFWALPAYVVLIALIVLFNLAVGHYREMLMADPDARSLQVLPRLMANPFAINELKSFALVIIGCLVAFIAAVKGYSAFGSYPGQASAFRRWRQSWQAVENERRTLDVDLLPELERLKSQIEAFREECGLEAGQLQRARAAADAARSDYVSRLAQLRTAKDSALAQYREANLKVRTDAPPSYFSQAANLPELDQPADLVEHAGLVALIADFERQLANLPALVEFKLRERLQLLRGANLADEIERVKARAVQAGRDAFEQDEAARRQIQAEFSATPR